VQDDANAGIGDLPGGFRAGEAAANDVDGISLGRAGNHARRVSAFSRQAHLPRRFRMMHRCRICFGRGNEFASSVIGAAARNDNARSEAGVIRSTGG
jgi:hypothetical protein